MTNETNVTSSVRHSVRGLSDYSPIILGAVVFTDAVVLAMGIIAVLLGYDPSFTTRTEMMLMVGCNLLAILLLFLVLDEQTIDSILLFKPLGRSSVLSIVIGVPCLVAITSLLPGSGFAEQPVSMSLSDTSPIFLLQLLVLLVLVFPLVEEVLFRGLLFGYVLDYSGSVLVTASVTMALFGLIHLEYGVLGAVSRAIASSVYVAQRIRHDSITESWLTHATYNFVVFMLISGVL